MSDAPAKLRLDKWLWHARFFKTRSLAAARVAAGDVRVNSETVTKRATTITPGDVLTFSIGHHVRVIQIKGIGARRGPAPEAQLLYSDLAPPQPKVKDDTPATPKFEGKGRPSKRDRRVYDLSQARLLE